MESALPVRAPFNTRHLCQLLAVTITVIAFIGCGDPKPVKTASDGSVMILIPTGTFPRGGTEEEVSEVADREYLSYLAERPVKDITITQFYIDKFEVTNAQYREFLDDAGGPPTRWDHPDEPEGVGHGQQYLSEDLADDAQPAVGVNWYDAYAYCNWAGKRLPTEAEWEYAARGPSYRIYPWGDHGPFDDGIYFANFHPESGGEFDGHKKSAPVGSYPDGVSPFGILDMAGNAEEWVNDWYSVNYFAQSVTTDPPGPIEGEQKVIKGGSYGTREWQVRIGKRFKGKPHNKGPRVGFRCVEDV